MSLKYSTMLEERVGDILESSLLSIGYEIVRVKISGNDDDKVLQIMIDRVDGKPVDVEDCQTASNHASALLDVEDPIENHYNLELSSPGIDRPLTRIKDFKKYIGFEVKLETNELVSGQRRFKGKIDSVLDNEDIVVRGNVVNIKDDIEPKFTIPFKVIIKAKLVLNDELLNNKLVN